MNKSGVGFIFLTGFPTTLKVSPLALVSRPLTIVRYGLEDNLHLESFFPFMSHNFSQVFPFFHCNGPPELAEQYSMKKSGYVLQFSDNPLEVTQTFLVETFFEAAVGVGFT